ncbi:MAG: AsmA-like C-terminal region-containing protein [Myxococcota bacterium]|nr:AsmA-like C-terminal region-containing protein [Myxococcota bacterium]
MTRSRLILGVALVGLVVPLVVLVFLQTESGFSRVVVPLASRFAPGSLEVASGRLGLGGSLTAEGLRFESAELGVRVVVGELFADLSLASLLSGPGPRVERLRLVGGEVEVFPAEEIADEPEPETATEADDGRLLLPVSISEAEIRDLRVRLLEGDAPWATLTSKALSVSGVVPGETGRITWSASALVQPPGEDLAYDGSVDLEAEVGRTSDGYLETWTAALVADVTGIPDERHTRFTLDSQGQLAGAGELSASTRVRAEREGKEVGEVDATLSTSAKPEGGEAVSASLALRSLNEAFLNPIIAPLRRGLIERAEIAGSLDITADLPIDTTALPNRAAGKLAIGRFDYRTLAVSGAQLTVDVTPERLTAELGPTRINRGRVSARVSHETSSDGETLQATAKARALDLTAVARAFREDLPAAVEGVLDLSASLSSRAAPGADLLEKANGTVTTELVRGRIEGFNPMSFLAAQSGVEAFKAIPIDDFDVNADVEIRNGVAYLEEEEVKATAAELVVNGTVALTGSADLTIEAFVGPSVSKTLGRLGIDMGSVKQYERMSGVPVAVRVSGPFENLSYGPATPRTAERAGKTADSASQALDDAVKSVTDLFKKK